MSRREPEPAPKQPRCSCTWSAWRIDDRPGGARLRNPDPNCPKHKGA